MVKYETRLIWVLTITFGFVFLDRNAANFLMPFIADDLHFNNQQIGLVASALSLTRAVAAFPVIVIFSFIGLLVPLAALLFQGSLFVLGTLIFIGWSASGTFPLFMGTVPSETIPARYVATSLGMVVGLGEILGGVGAPAIAGRAADLYGLQAPVILMAICAMVGTVLALFLRETAPMRLPQHWLSAPGDQCP